MRLRQKRDFSERILDTRDFLRTLSYREFVTSCSTALLLVAFYGILDFYSGEDWVDKHGGVIRTTLFCISLPVNHIFYKVDHKRPNNFVGRNFHDYIFILFFVLLNELRMYFYGWGISFDIADIGIYIATILIIAILVMLFELAVAIVKRGLKLVRWQIL